MATSWPTRLADQPGIGSFPVAQLGSAGQSRSALFFDLLNTGEPGTQSAYSTQRWQGIERGLLQERIAHAMKGMEQTRAIYAIPKSAFYMKSTLALKELSDISEPTQEWARVIQRSQLSSKETIIGNARSKRSTKLAGFYVISFSLLSMAAAFLFLSWEDLQLQPLDAIFGGVCLLGLMVELAVGLEVNLRRVVKRGAS